MAPRIWSARCVRVWEWWAPPRCRRCTTQNWSLRRRSRPRARAGSWQERFDHDSGVRDSMTESRSGSHRVATSDDIEVGTYLEIAEAEESESRTSELTTVRGPRTTET